MMTRAVAGFWDFKIRTERPQWGRSAADKPAIFVLFMAASARGEM
jgi:hypothetical protein